MQIVDVTVSANAHDTQLVSFWSVVLFVRIDLLLPTCVDSWAAARVAGYEIVLHNDESIKAGFSPFIVFFSIVDVHNEIFVESHT